MIKAAIFDWDGTLADTKKPVVKSFQHVLKENGCVTSNKTIERWVGIGTKKTFEKILEECNIKYNEKIIEKLSAEKINFQLRLTNSVTLFKGVVELLEELKGKINIALATMSNRIVVEKILSEKSIRNYFNVILSADDVNHPKPNPEVFLASAKKLGIKPKECVVIEDSIFGVKAAKKAGMKCIAIPSGSYNEKELQKEHPDIIVESIAKKGKILSFIFSQKK
jgi:HAD superfamily hydrolase (TIGR01509 family)